MAAGGFKEFVAGETLDEDEINDFLMQGVLVFAGTAARGSAITAPVEGQFSFLKDSDRVEFYDGTEWVELVTGINISYLVIGGGGGAALHGAGGAGGYRCNVVGEASGGSAVAEPKLGLPAGVYQIVVGAGGAGVSGGNAGTKGSLSRFANIFSTGGGRGGGFNSGQRDGGDGGSGGGGGFRQSDPGGDGVGDSIYPGLTFAEGFDGGDAQASNTSSTGAGGGGGGASARGQDSPADNDAGNGGGGVTSSITGSAVGRAGGGGGGAQAVSGGGTATDGGGAGGGGSSSNGQNGTANTGGGGGGGGSGAGGASPGTPGNGGSGLVVFTVPTGTSVSFTGGVTQSSSTVGTNDVYVVTATSTEEELVTIS